ncbi:hypothetical protein L6452_03324 [Arctium lappa]|uniref:Uncharacterized protein n=1 Tax=Arctium lappa TaxID=4217 RepID=A0ACB9FLB7_ARCLA|nr:hypothetical protein L6452_03324 [Arctium lappa]
MYGRIGTRNALAWYLDVFFDDLGTDSDESLLTLGFRYESGKSSEIAKIPSQIDKITRLLDGRTRLYVFLISVCIRLRSINLVVFLNDSVRSHMACKDVPGGKNFKDMESPKLSAIPVISFGEQLERDTEGSLTAAQTLASTTLCGIIHAIVGGQPLLILGVAEPTVLMYTFMFKFAKDQKDLGPPLFLAWSGCRENEMVSLKLQKRLAASVLKCGRGKVWLDPNEGNEISMANSHRCNIRDDIGFMISWIFLLLWDYVRIHVLLAILF